MLIIILSFLLVCLIINFYYKFYFLRLNKEGFEENSELLNVQNNTQPLKVVGGGWIIKFQNEGENFERNLLLTQDTDEIPKILRSKAFFPAPQLDPTKTKLASSEIIAIYNDPNWSREEFNYKITKKGKDNLLSLVRIEENGSDVKKLQTAINEKNLNKLIVDIPAYLSEDLPDQSGLPASIVSYNRALVQSSENENEYIVSGPLIVPNYISNPETIGENNNTPINLDNAPIGSDDGIKMISQIQENERTDAPVITEVVDYDEELNNYLEKYKSISVADLQKQYMIGGGYKKSFLPKLNSQYKEKFMREKSIQESSLIGGWSCLLDETPDKLCDSDGNWKCTPSTENKVCLPVCKKLTYDAGGFWNFTDGENSTLVYFIEKKIDSENSEKSTLVFNTVNVSESDDMLDETTTLMANQEPSSDSDLDPSIFENVYVTIIDGNTTSLQNIFTNGKPNYVNDVPGVYEFNNNSCHKRAKIITREEKFNRQIGEKVIKGANYIASKCTGPRPATEDPEYEEWFDDCGDMMPSNTKLTPAEIRKQNALRMRSKSRANRYKTLNKDLTTTRMGLGPGMLSSGPSTGPSRGPARGPSLGPAVGVSSRDAEENLKNIIPDAETEEAIVMSKIAEDKEVKAKAALRDVENKAVSTEVAVKAAMEEKKKRRRNVNAIIAAQKATDNAGETARQRANAAKDAAREAKQRRDEFIQRALAAAAKAKTAQATAEDVQKAELAVAERDAAITSAEQADKLAKTQEKSLEVLFNKKKSLFEKLTKAREEDMKANNYLKAVNKQKDETTKAIFQARKYAEDAKELVLANSQNLAVVQQKAIEKAEEKKEELNQSEEKSSNPIYNMFNLSIFNNPLTKKVESFIGREGFHAADHKEPENVTDWNKGHLKIKFNSSGASGTGISQKELHLYLDGTEKYAKLDNTHIFSYKKINESGMDIIELTRQSTIDQGKLDTNTPPNDVTALRALIKSGELSKIKFNDKWTPTVGGSEVAITAGEIGINSLTENEIVRYTWSENTANNGPPVSWCPAGKTCTSSVTGIDPEIIFTGANLNNQLYSNSCPEMTNLSDNNKGHGCGQPIKISHQSIDHYATLKENPIVGRNKQFFPVPWHNTDDRGPWKADPGTQYKINNGMDTPTYAEDGDAAIAALDASFIAYYNDKLNVQQSTLQTNKDSRGYILACNKLVNQAGYKYARIDNSGCWGGNELDYLKNRSGKSDYQGQDDNYTRVYSTSRFLNEIEAPRNYTEGSREYKGITCSITPPTINSNTNRYDLKSQWVCASNCIFDGVTGPGLGNVSSSNLYVSDQINSDGENIETGWRGLPENGVIKHNSIYNFNCNAGNKFYAEAGGDYEDKRRCMYGKLSNTLSRNFKCTKAEQSVAGCQVISDPDDDRCLLRVQNVPQPAIEGVDQPDKLYKYCPIMCTNKDGNDYPNKCQSHKACAKHLFKHDVNDIVKKPPFKNPWNSGDNLGYNRIEVDKNGKSVVLNAESEKQIAHYNDLIQESSTGKKEINTSVLESGTLKGLFGHFTNNMKLGDMAAFVDGIKNYFDPNKFNKKTDASGATEWLNDPGYYGLGGDGGLQGAGSSIGGNSGLSFAEGGKHLLKDELILEDPTQYKNKNQYSAIARNELYNKKRNKDEKVLNPTTIPKEDLVLLGRIVDQEKNLKKKLESQYLTEQEKYDLKMKLSRMSNEKMKMIKKIKEKEMSYYNTVGQHDGEVPFKRDDQKYVPFMNNSQQTYQNSRGQRLQVPQPVGRYY